MSSFKRRVSPSVQKPEQLPAGTRTSPSLASVLLTSTGIPSLDDILGGGIQLGTDFLVLSPDPHSGYGELIQKYFIAQGLAIRHDTYVFDPNAKQFVESCMWATDRPIGGEYQDPEEESTDNVGKVKIAWRYEAMQKFKTTVSSQSMTQEDYCRTFDLTCTVPPRVIEDSLMSGLLHLEEQIFNEENVLESLIRFIEGVGKSRDTQGEPSRQECVRLCFPNFASPLWGDLAPEDILRFLLQLRSSLRRFPFMCASLALPHSLSSELWVGSAWTEQLGWLTDACIVLNSFTSDPSTSAFLASHHGLLSILNLPHVHTLVPASDTFSSLRGFSSHSSSVSSGGVGENNLAFKCTRRRFIIETFHLDVEGGVGERRTAPSASAVIFQDTLVHASPQSSVPKSRHPNISAIEVKLDEDVTTIRPPPLDRISSVAEETREKKANPKKTKKRVGFQVDRPDLYDF